jgi:hypothetical protein
MDQMQYEGAVRTILPGVYQHYKGNYYKVLCIARHSETTEPMVVYKALYDDGGMWTRPAAMWNETVEHEGQTVLRFRQLSLDERVSFYEELFDEVSAAGDSDASDVQQKLRILEDYYTSGQWLEDYEADEQGLLPDDLKRGVLSQDALYDLLDL